METRGGESGVAASSLISPDMNESRCGEYKDAASRLEHVPDRKAIEVLKLVKAKTAGAILAQVKADRAAKLTEQLLAQTP